MSVATVLGVLKQVIKMDLLETMTAAAAAAVGAAAGAAAVTVATTVLSGKREQNDRSGAIEESATQPRSGKKDERKKSGRSKRNAKLKERHVHAATRCRVSDSDDACVDNDNDGIDDSHSAGEERRKWSKTRRRDRSDTEGELYAIRTKRKKHKSKNKDRDRISSESPLNNVRWSPLYNSMSPPQPQLVSSPLDGQAPGSGGSLVELQVTRQALLVALSRVDREIAEIGAEDMLG